MDATTLQQAVRILDPLLRGRRVRGTAIAAATLDLCLFIDGSFPGGVNALRVALGPAARRRLLIERVRLSRDEHLEGENARALARELDGATVESLSIPPNERTITLEFDTERGSRRIVAELFGGRGNWFLLDEKSRVLALAARPGGQRSAIGPGTTWTQAPGVPGAATRDDAGAELAVADDEAWLVERATHYARLDTRLEIQDVARELETMLRRERKGLAGRKRGLEERQAAEGRAEILRREAELLLASPDVARRGLDRITVRDWYEEGRERELALDAKIDVRGNAERRFARAKTLEDGRVHTARELDALRAKEERFEQFETRRLELAAAADEPATLDALLSLRREVRESARPRKGAAQKRRAKAKQRQVYHEFTSQDGTKIWVGRGRADNDKLTLRHARGNDIWLHIGGGLAGSHVVVRLDRGKTASLETLLDAGTLALWFSKARGRPHAEVIYTPRKNVRKPKGFALGLVEVLRSKTLQIRFEDDRLRRLLDTQRQTG